MYTVPGNGKVSRLITFYRCVIVYWIFCSTDQTNLRVISITVSFSRSNSCFIPINSIYPTGKRWRYRYRVWLKKAIHYTLEGLRVRITGCLLLLLLFVCSLVVVFFFCFVCCCFFFLFFFVISFCFYVFFFRFMFISFLFRAFHGFKNRFMIKNAFKKFEK